MKVKLSDTFLSFLEGTELWAYPDKLDNHGYGEGGRSLIEKINTSRSKTGIVDLNEKEREVVWDYARTMAGAAADDAGWGDMSALGELNSARALMRQIEKMDPEVCTRGFVNPFKRARG